MQPCCGITWWGSSSRWLAALGNFSSRCLLFHHRTIDPECLENPRPEWAEVNRGSCAPLGSSVDRALHWVRCRLRGQVRSASTCCEMPVDDASCEIRNRGIRRVSNLQTVL